MITREYLESATSQEFVEFLRARGVLTRFLARFKPTTQNYGKCPMHFLDDGFDMSVPDCNTKMWEHLNNEWKSLNKQQGGGLGEGDLYDPKSEGIKHSDPTEISIPVEAKVTLHIEDLDEDKPDMVNKPPHYNSHPSGIQAIEVCRHYGFSIGNAMKYLWRQGLKQSSGKSSVEKQIEDLEKAKWYINDEIERLKNESN